MDYKKQLVKFNLNTFAIMSLIMFIVPFLICACINIFALNNGLLLTKKVYFDVLILIAGLIAGIVVHELFHALGGLITGQVKAKEIKFGANLKQGLFYCHFEKPMTIKAYMFVLILPIIVTGIIPLIISTIFGNIFLVLLFSFMVSGGAGDVLMFVSLLKQNKNSLILDHDSAPAYYLLYDENNLPEDFVECTEEMENELKESMKQNIYATKDGKKNPLIKILLISLFLALLVLGMFVVALILEFI